MCHPVSALGSLSAQRCSALLVHLLATSVRAAWHDTCHLAQGAIGQERVRKYNENWRSYMQRMACLTLAGTIVAEVATGKARTLRSMRAGSPRPCCPTRLQWSTSKAAAKYEPARPRITTWQVP